LLLAGCQPANRYNARPTSSTAKEETKPAPVPVPAASGPAPLPPDLTWKEAIPVLLRQDVPIVFIWERDPTWRDLPRFWNASLAVPAGAAAILGVSPLTAGPLAARVGDASIQVRVPAGLPDPRPLVPAFNPPTRNKWELGRRLFFDNTYLEAKPGLSCAGCHDPVRGFTDGLAGHGGLNTLSLINVMYNRAQFWDGRVTYLEEVVQRTAEDEREPVVAKPGFRHTWPGVIGRLRNNPAYVRHFEDTFGAEPTQDAVGKALATYLRTILAGDSLHDRARRAQALRGGAMLEPADYTAVLDEATLRRLGRAGTARKAVAEEVHHGYLLFHDLEFPQKTGCVRCHVGPLFTDQGFHNLGIGWQGKYEPGKYEPGKETGRFAGVGVGAKDRRLIGAFRTPSLRNLARTAPYMHDGSLATLAQVLHLYNQGGERNSYLDPALFDGKNPLRQRTLNLSSEDLEALAVFLRSLDGQPPDPVVMTAPE
jgi:cytochrome c peroxidase